MSMKSLFKILKHAPWGRAVFLFWPPSILPIARAHPRPCEFAMDPQIGNLHLLCRWVVSQAYMFTHSHTAQYFHPAPWTWETVPPQRAVTRVSLQGVDQTPFLPPKTGWIRTGFLLIWGVGLPSWFQVFPGSFVWLKLASSVCWERGSIPWDKPVWWCLAGAALWWAGNTERSENTTLNPRLSTQKCFRKAQGERWATTVFRKQVY
jgi:hypothetical protein